MGVLEPMLEEGSITPIGELANELISRFSEPYRRIVLIEDFADVSDWGVGKGSAAGGGEITVNSVEFQQGGKSGQLDYQVSEAKNSAYAPRLVSTLASQPNGWIFRI